MIHLAIVLPALIGFICLLLAKPRHQQDWLARKLAPGATRRLKWGGLGALALALLVAGIGLGWAYGSVTWLGWLSAAAALVLIAHTNRARIQRRLP